MNAIYKVIFNRATGKPVVVSELGKGKLKSSASRAVKSAILLAIVGMNASVSASICNVTSMTCQLDQQWSYLNNNNRAGGVKINDGQMWDVSGVNSCLLVTHLLCNTKT